MSITRKFANIFAGVVVALVAFGMMAATASAAFTATERAALGAAGLTTAQIAAIEMIVGGSTQSTTTTTTGPGFVFTTTLRPGMSSEGVFVLQSSLNAVQDPDIVVDGAYGPATSAAVRQFQMSKGLTADGILGPNTGAALQAASTTTIVVATPDAEDESEDEDMDDEDLASGEASIEQFTMDSEDDAEEGAEAHVATIEFDVEDGDAMIDRIDVTFDSAAVGGTADDEPWDVFETLTVMVDGEEVASEDINDEDDWLDNDQGGADTETTFRLSGVDYVAREGETVEMEIYLTAENSVDDSANADWTIFIADDGIRYTDGEGITDTFGDDGETVAFDVDEEGGDESIEIKSSSNDPDAAVLKVEDDTDSDWYEVFIFRLESEESDIELDTLEFTFTSVSANYEDIVNDVMIEIDGESFDDFDVVDENTTTADLTFDIDGDFTVDADETVEVVVMVEFREADQDGDGTADGAYDDTAEETLAVTVTAVDGEGKDDVSDTSTLTSEAHSLDYAVADLTVENPNVDRNEDGDAGVISFEFTLDASDSDEDIVLAVADRTDVHPTTDEVDYTLFGTDTGIANATITLIDGDATYAGGAYTILEGDEATFVLDVTFTTVDANDNGTYRVRLDSVDGITVDETSAGMALTF